MNIKRLKKLRDFIATLPAGACDMKYWQAITRNKDKTVETAGIAYHPHHTFKEMKKKGFACGSVACIGGWTEMLFNKATENENEPEIYKSAIDILQLKFEEARHLFNEYPRRNKDWKEWILRRLDGVIKDGKVESYAKQMRRKEAKK